MGARTAIQLAAAILVIIHATPCQLGHQRRGVLPARASLARPTAFVPPSRPDSPRDVFVRLPLSVEPNVGQASDGVQFVARGHGDSVLRLEDGDEGRRLRRSVALPECLMPRNSCHSSTEEQLPN